VFEWLAAPKAVFGKARKATGVRAARVRLGLPDASGRQAPEEAPDSQFDLRADLIIMALGFDPEDLRQLWSAPELKVTRAGTLRVDGKLQTNAPGVFAAGDIVRGASLVVWAIRDGRDAAEGIHAYLKARALEGARIAAE
jgi:glutamate synthase (NADPH/NADH) small chain